MKSWHIRFCVTSRCNFRCCYCNPDGLSECNEDLSKEEVLEIVKAAYLCGIERVHWTGGEPTLRNDFIELVQGAKDIGYKEQVVTTNGYRLCDILEECIAAGLSRVIVSLDSLQPERNLSLTGKDYLNKTIATLSESVRLLPIVTKMNVTTMRSTLSELNDIVLFVKDLNSRQGNLGWAALKLIEFYPSNPAQLFSEGQDLCKKEFINEREVMDWISSMGEAKVVFVVGDNPNCRYYFSQNGNIIIGVLAMFSWDYPCGDCRKFRVTPFGSCSICLHDPYMPILKGKDFNKKVEIIKGTDAAAREFGYYRSWVASFSLAAW